MSQKDRNRTPHPEKPANFANNECYPEHGDQQAGVDGMTNDGVRSPANEGVTLLYGHRRTPVTAQVKSSPNRKSDAHCDQEQSGYADKVSVWNERLGAPAGLEVTGKDQTKAEKAEAHLEQLGAGWLESGVWLGGEHSE